MELRKREYSEDEGGYGIGDIKRSKVSIDGSGNNRRRGDYLIQLPREVLALVLEELNRKDVINLGCVSREYRMMLYCEIFNHVRMKWHEIKRFMDHFKHLDKVCGIRIVTDLRNEKETNHGEWNVSFRDVLRGCVNLKSMEIELLTSGRSLKYKDDFDVDVSDKIEEMTLVSHSETSNYGDINEKAMFELTQLQRFHQIKKLTLERFSITKDTYFYPRMKEDLSDYERRSLDGKLVHLQHLRLVDCVWGYPMSLKEVFAPEYPIAGGGAHAVRNCRPRRIELVYRGEFIRFTSCERFKNFVNCDYNDKFLFEVEFYSELRELVIAMDRQGADVSVPWIECFNFRREFFLGGRRTTLLSRLQRLVLTGFRVSSAVELERCLSSSCGYNLESVHIGIVSTVRDSELLVKQCYERLDTMFNGAGAHGARAQAEPGLGARGVPRVAIHVTCV